MPDLTVKTIYEAVVRNYDRVDDIIRQNERLQNQNVQLTSTVRRLTSEHERHESVLLRARHALIAFRREMFAIGITAGALAALLRGLSGTSDALAERFERLGDVVIRTLQPVGDALARMLGGKGELSRGQRAGLLGLEADILRLRGDQYAAALKQMEAEEIKFTEKIRTLSEEKKRIFRSEFDERRRLALERERLSEFGLRSQEENVADLKRGIGSGAQTATADVIFKFLQAEHQTITDVLKSFQAAINRTIADFLARSLFTALFKTLDPQLRELQKQTELLRNIGDCVCRLPGGGGGGTLTATITGGGRGGVLGAIGSIAGAVGSLANLGAAGFALAGGIGAGGANITMAPGANIPKFQHGGEVPAFLTPGEFVVNRQATHENRDLLRDINAGGFGRSKKAPMYVFIKASDAKSFDDMLSTTAARDRLEMQINRALMSNGTFRRLLKEFGS